MEGTNQLLKNQFYKIFQATMGVSESDTDKNRFMEVLLISLGAECN